MASNSDKVRNWWGTLNSMSKAELYFKQTLDAHNDISTRRPRAMLISAKSPIHGEAPTHGESPPHGAPPILGEPTITEFREPQKLLGSLQYDIKDDIHARRRPWPRDLIILEDLSREWVEALGPHLGIPVSVFALHWADPTEHVNGGLRVPIGESPARHFILSYRQSLPFFIKNRQNNITVNGVDKGQPRRRTLFRIKVLVADFGPELEYRLDCNVVRPTTSRPNKHDDNEPETIEKEPETSEQLVTYYCSRNRGSATSSKEY